MNIEGCRCEFCGSSVSGQPFLALNRYVLSNGSTSDFVEVLNQGDECVFRMPTAADRGGSASAVLIHVECMPNWLAGEMLSIGKV